MDKIIANYFSAYEKFVNQVDSIFESVKEKHNENVKCKSGCADCCHALFDLTFIEAFYISEKFHEKFYDVDKQKILDKANKADREIYKIKKKAYKKFQQKTDEVEILGDISMERVRCPMLNDKDECDMYENRPITCRVYGIPTSTQGKSHICGESNFELGEQYPTLNMDRIYENLYKISSDLVSDLNTTHEKMYDMLVPLSMAVLTRYTKEYLGINESAKKKKEGE